MKYFITLITVLIHGMNASADDWSRVTTDDFLAAMTNITDKVQKNASYSVDLSYTTYELSKNEIIHDYSSGYVKKSGIDTHSFTMGIHTIQNEKCRVVVDSINEIIAVTNPMSVEFNEMAPALSKELYKNVKSIRKRNTDGIISYEVVFGENMPIISFVLQVDQQQLMKQVDIVYRRQLKSNSQQDTNLRLRLAFNNWIFNPKFSQEVFSMSRYVNEEKDNYSPSSAYSNYQLSDQRIK
jgi:hypothetical protein